LPLLNRRRAFAILAAAASGVFAAFVPAGRRATVGAQPGISGTAPTSATVGPVTLRTGIVVIQVQYNGTGRLSASLAQSGALPRTVPLFDRGGPFKASAATLIAAAGSYYAQITAPQACELLFQQPLPETVKAVSAQTLSGQGKDVSAYFTLPITISTLSVQTTGANLRAWLYHLDDGGGEAIQGGVAGNDGRFFDLAAPAAQTAYAVTLPDAGPYLIAVESVAPSDTWTFVFS
jgi:hypothetical protein